MLATASTDDGGGRFAARRCRDAALPRRAANAFAPRVTANNARASGAVHLPGGRSGLALAYRDVKRGIRKRSISRCRRYMVVLVSTLSPWRCDAARAGTRGNVRLLPRCFKIPQWYFAPRCTHMEKKEEKKEGRRAAP